MKDEKLHPQGDGVLGHGEEFTCLAYAQCPMRLGDYPSTDTLRPTQCIAWGWSNSRFQ